MSRISDKRKIPDNKYYGFKPRQSNKEGGSMERELMERESRERELNRKKIE